MLLFKFISSKFSYISNEFKKVIGIGHWFEEEGTVKVWYLNGQLHRENGPAVEYTDGDKSWWIDGYCIDNLSNLFEQYIFIYSVGCKVIGCKKNCTYCKAQLNKFCG